MKSKKYLNGISLLEIENEGDKTILDMQACFEKILNNFIRTQKDIYILLETIILSCVLSEAIVKEKLREINPSLTLNEITPISIAVITNKTKKLRKELQKNDYNIKSAPFSVLLNRFLEFYEVPENPRFLMEFFTIRNCIAHSAKGQIVDEKRVAILLTKYIFPFVYEYVPVSESLWKKILRLQKVAHNNFKISLARKIADYEKIASAIPEDEKYERMKKELILPYKEEFEDTTDLVCPACHFPSMSYIFGVDIDGGPDGVEAYGYDYAKCKVCSLELKTAEYTEMLENSEDYFTGNEVYKWYEATLPLDYSGIDF